MRYWLAMIPHNEFEHPIHDKKFVVLICSNHVVGPIFSNQTTSTQVYLNIFEEFYSQLTYNEKGYILFNKTDQYVKHFTESVDVTLMN